MRGIRGFIPETTPCIPTLLDSAHDTVLMGPCKLRKDFFKKSNNFLKTKKNIGYNKQEKTKKRERKTQNISRGWYKSKQNELLMKFYRLC